MLFYFCLYKNILRFRDSEFWSIISSLSLSEPYDAILGKIELDIKFV